MKYARKIRKIMELLNKAYGRPQAWRRSDAVDELIRTVLSQNTSDANSLRAFSSLKERFESWDRLRHADKRTIARTIRHAGLANIKAGRIRDILSEIKRREGAICLSRLERLTVDDGLSYLKSLKGVGPKTAACVLLFSFKKPVMPVDTHIFRVAKRLGLIDEKLNVEKAHAVLGKIVPKGLILRHRPGSSPERLSRDLIYEFHLGIIEHGRRTCKAQKPKCWSCVLYRLCRFEDKALYASMCLSINRKRKDADTKSQRN